MKIRTRLTIQNLLVTATVFLAVLVTIYFVSEHTRSQAFYHDLKGEALTKAQLFLENQVDAETMQSIYLNNKKYINEVEVAVYTPDFEMLYHDARENDIIKETPQMIDEIIAQGDLEFEIGEYQGIGMVHEHGGKKYIVTAAAYDGYGRHNQAELNNTLGMLLVIGLVLLAITGYFLAYTSLRPMRKIAKEADAITGRHIERRLEVKNKNDELGELCSRFNELLARLEVSFNAQRQFVSNVSHELRTPLAALHAELDLTLQKERTPEQYRAAIERSLSDADRMARLVEGLLNLAKADYEREGINMEPLRLDELLLDVHQVVMKSHPDYHVELVFEQEEAEDEQFITVMGNRYLLSIAFSNLIENNCKYSDDRTSFVQIAFWERWAILRFSDDGRGMSSEDKDKLFTLFYRGSESHNTEGHGIGMTLAQKIVNLHGGTITVHSQIDAGTTFVVQLPHLKSENENT